ncbi:unnamed protein product [Mytilus coruscus]|uniref:Uncharacterized protein n=1 Tax=Mytilus coruscus TaxID=42192 RepID=A0A6J8E3X1_MYTCO|nr:unnamed protein product [Mytilus coruscus]CAC5414816.1 unnamed protein product [Mytilus coruscus]
MYTKELILIAISVFVTEGQDGQVGSTCEFPCELRGKMVDINFQEMFFGSWSFFNDGITSAYNTMELRANLTCHRVVERFLIVRVDKTNVFRCIIFDYNAGMQPIEFSYGVGGAVVGTEFDLCDICGGKKDIFLAIESGEAGNILVLEGWVSENGLASGTGSLPCTVPSTCVGDSCGANDTLPEGCPTTTSASTTTAEATTTHRKRCNRRRHNH